MSMESDALFVDYKDLITINNWKEIIEYLTLNENMALEEINESVELMKNPRTIFRHS